MTKKVLLICGAGASSGFMAAAARKAIKNSGEDMEFKARSESEMTENLSSVDLLLVAPHLKYMIDGVKGVCEAAGVKYGIIPQRVYGSLDGKGLIGVAKELLEGGK
ncbi:Lichenan-specific phosphotransferase enzyme IIB component [compost metagenome]